MSRELGAPSAEETAQFSEIVAHAFGFPKSDSPAWLAKAGHEHVRVLREGNALLAGLVTIPMGQRFGGRVVPTLGIAGVAVRPEHRGQGVATELMVATLREARARGIPLSTLYPATVSLYRRCGYERAGARNRIALDPSTLHLPRLPREAVLDVREVTGCPSDVRALYTETAGTGFLERGSYVWNRIVEPRGKETKTFTFSDTSTATLEAYVVLAHKTEGEGTALELVDLAARSARGAKAVLRFCAEYRSVANEMFWHGGQADLFTTLLPERHARISLRDFFMVRVTCAELALAARGYPKHVACALTVEVDDASMPEASGAFALRIRDGRGEVERAPNTRSGPRLVLNERSLAALYTGHLSTDVLARAGWLEADNDTKALCDTLFAGPQPTMRDMF